MKKIIIFGATGGIGAYTLMHLLEQNCYKLIAVGHRKNDNSFFESKGVPYFSVDIEDYKSFDCLPKENIDAVVNMAGVLPSVNFDNRKFITSFTLGQLNVLEYMREVGCKKIIFAQTPADLWYLQDSRTPMPADAQRSFPPASDHSIYTIAKNAAIDITQYYHNMYGIKWFALRFFNVYMYDPNPFFHVNGIKRWVAFRLMIEKAKTGEDIEVWGDPMRSKEVVYVKDVAQLISQCIEDNEHMGIYNVGSTQQITLEEQVNGIIHVFTNDKQSKKIYRPDKPNALLNHLDISKTITELGYAPKYNYIDWLKDFKKEEQLNRFKSLWGDPSDYK